MNFFILFPFQKINFTVNNIITTVKRNIRNCNCPFPYVCCVSIARRMKWALFAFFHLGLVCSNVYSQHPYNPVLVDPLTESWRWKSYPELVGKGVRSIVETKDGSIWFGLDKGIIRYDGINWHTFNNKDGLADNPINLLCVERGNIVYAGSDSGLYQFVANGWTKIFPSVFQSSQSKFYKVYSIKALPGGGIVASVGTDMFGGLLLIRNHRSTFFSSQKSIDLLKGRYPGLNLRTVPENVTFGDKFNIEELFVDKQERIWASTRNGFSNGYILNFNISDRDSLIVLKTFTDKDGLKQGKQTFFGQTRDGSIWTVNY